MLTPNELVLKVEGLDPKKGAGIKIYVKDGHLAIEGKPQKHVRVIWIQLLTRHTNDFDISLLLSRHRIREVTERR